VLKAYTKYPLQIGMVAQTFDPDVVEKYPRGYVHDVSLVEPDDDNVIEDIKAPITGLGWLSEQGWHNVRSGSTSLRVMVTPNPDLKLIPNICPSDIQVRGPLSLLVPMRLT
jgi:hypothetical protein